MIWVDREVKKIKQRELPLEWVDDMKTPSGRIHVGSLRGVVIHDLLYKVLLENGVKAKYTYVFDDQDPMDSIPSYLDFSKWEQYAGMQLYKIPSPEKGYASFAQFYAQEFITVFETINCHPDIIWGSQLYNSGKMNEVIKTILDATETIRKIYLKISKKPRPKNWHPFNVVCANCSKIGTTFVYRWDGKQVYYKCEAKMVAWAKGCGFEGKISPFNGNGKIPWKVEWPAKWKVIGVTVEWSGKDHMSSGGSFDIASAVAREVFDYEPPYASSYEWFTVGGRKMASSKGIGTSAKEVTQILPPEVMRFFIVRTPVHTHLDFDPYGGTILNLFDDFDRCLNAYFDKLEDKITEGKEAEVLSDFARIIELSEVRPAATKRMFLPRFRTVVNLIKTKTDILKFFEQQKGRPLTSEEKETLEERVVFAQVYLTDYASQEEKIQLSTTPVNQIRLTKPQQLFLTKLADKLAKLKSENREKIQQVVFAILKEHNLSAKDVFPGFYQVILDRSFGPKAADLIIEFGIKNVAKRLKEV